MNTAPSTFCSRRSRSALPRLLALALLLAGTPARGRERLVVWGLSTQSEWDRGTQVVTEEFERRYGVEVETFSPGDFGEQKALTAIAGGTPPDVLPLGIYTRDWLARGALQPLDAFIARDREQPDGIHLEDYYPASLDHVTIDGRVYAIPDWAFAFGLYYNRALFAEAGLVDTVGQPKPPATWEEWYRDNQLLTRRDEQGRLTRVGSYPSGYVPSLFTLATQLGAHFVSPDGQTCTLDEPPVREALRRLVMFSDFFGNRQALEAFKASTNFAGLDPLLAGGEAMRVEGQWMITNFARFGPQIDYDVAPVPHPEGYPGVEFQSTYSFGIPVGALHPELAWEFLKWYASTEAQELKVRETIEFTRNRGMPFTPFTLANRRLNQRIAREYVLDNPLFSEKTRRIYAAFLQILERATYRLPVNLPAGRLLDDELTRVFEAAVQHRQDPEQFLAQAQGRVQEALDLYRQEETLPLVPWSRLLLAGGLLGGGTLLWLGLVLRGRLRRLGGQRRREALVGLLFVMPWGVGFVLLMAGPILWSLLISFTHYSVLKPARWVGLNNYASLTADPLFWKSLGNTCFMMLGIPLGMSVGLALALLLQRTLRGMAVYRTLYYLPSIVPAVASALLWVWIFDPTSGLFNRMLASLGLAGPLWLQSEVWAKPAILLQGLWGAGSGMIIWLAGLNGVPQHLHEAAAIDGANRWQRFRYVTLPLLTPQVFFTLIMGTIGTLQIFTEAMVMTRGGPADSTLFYVYYLFDNAFSYFRMGYAAAMAWVLFVLIFLLTLFQLKVAPRWVYYEGENPG